MKHSDERVGLGLEKMTRSFMQFPFAELSTGEWIGEDLLFSSSSTLSENLSLQKHIQIFRRFEEII